MKKILLTVVVLAGMCSCTSIQEKAYVAECNYKAYRSSADSLLYKEEFMRIYLSMDYQDREAYKRYRKCIEAEIAKNTMIEAQIRQEAEGFLNE